MVRLKQSCTHGERWTEDVTDIVQETVPKQSVCVLVESVYHDLLLQEDTDRDYQITVDDKGPKVFRLRPLRSDDGRHSEIRGTYFLSNLLQELTIGKQSHRKTLKISFPLILEDPVTRICRRIADMFWDNLSRRMDRALIQQFATDPKDWTAKPVPRIYVPHDAQEQFENYSEIARMRPEMGLEVLSLPRGPFTGEFVRSLNSKPGILALQTRREGLELRGLEFVVPGGRFNELYGWDSYFCCIGLLEVGRVHIARDIALNFCFEIENYGCILNANRTYYLGRSQPPFLTDLALRVYQKLGDDPGAKDFLRTAIVAAIKEYHQVWMSEPRLHTKSGLSRYRPVGGGMPPEVEDGQFDHILLDRARACGLSKMEFIDAYNKGRIEDDDLDRYLLHDRAVRESGHDTSFRLQNTAADLATVDLNALLFKYETDIAWAIRNVFDGRLDLSQSILPDSVIKAKIESHADWLRRAETRQELVNRYLWNERRKTFCDYNTASEEQTDFDSVTCLWPLWSGMASAHQASLLVSHALPKFEQYGGLSCTSSRSLGPTGPEQPQRQWDFPYGWAPHQMLAWTGLERYGYKREAERLAYRWLLTITQTAVDFNGIIVEKYDVTRRRKAHEVDAEYGNQGRHVVGIAREGFGWTNASYTYGLKFIDPALCRLLALGVPAEGIARLFPNHRTAKVEA